MLGLELPSPKNRMIARLTPFLLAVLETYTYGASRERLMVETSSQRRYFAWGGQNVLAEYTETSTTPEYVKSYIYADSRHLTTFTKTSSTSETKELQHPDRLGTPLVTDGTTGSSFRQSTMPFGVVISSETTGNTNYVFTSYDRSSTTGLDYAVNRTYSKGQSRFTQVDPSRMAYSSVGNPQSNNLYSYVQNMPTDFIDPSGLFLEAGSCYLITNGTIYPDGRIIIRSQIIICIPGQTASTNQNGSGWGLGGNGAVSSTPQTREKLSKECADALKSVGLLKKTESALYDNVIDVNGIENEKASNYFGSAGAGMTVGEYFDNKQPEEGGAYTFRAGRTSKGVPTGRSGTYRRGGDVGMSFGLRVHETVHRVQAKAKKLDAALVKLLGVETSGKTDSKALDDYFESGCDPSLLRKAQPKKKR